MSEMDDVLNLNGFHAVNGWMCFAKWERGGKTRLVYAVCDDCFEAEAWPRWWPNGRWERAFPAESVRRCRMCNGRMETLDLTA